MYARKEEEQGEFYHSIHNIQGYHDHPWLLPPVHTYNATHFTNPVQNNHNLLHVPPPTTSSSFNRRTHPSLHFPIELGSVVEPCSDPWTAKDIMDAKALAASKSHSEAERRRRERINNHLTKLRSLLPSTTKTDKASLLAEVIQHVKELKSQTSLIAETNPVPTELDELTVINAAQNNEDNDDSNTKYIIKASFCCEDRSDLLPELIKTLKSLHLRTLKAEITTLGGRVRNVLFIAGDKQHHLSSIQEAFRAVMEKTSHDDQSSSVSGKRQRKRFM